MPRRRTRRRSRTRNHRKKRTTSPRTRRRTRRAKRKIQRGGLAVCATGFCVPMALKAAGVGAAAAGAAATYFSHKSRSSRTMENGREKLKRTETYKMKNKNGEIETKKFIQNGKRVMKITNDKKIYDKKFDTTEDATNHIEKAIKRCKKRGFKKC